MSPKQIAAVCCPGRSTGRSAGFGLISAIFLIVVVALLALAVASLVRTSSAAYGQDVLALQAFAAAESGAALALNRVFAPSGVGSCTSRNFDFTAPGLNGCRAQVECTELLIEGEPHYELLSLGHCQAGANFAQRQILLRARP